MGPGGAFSVRSGLLSRQRKFVGNRMQSFVARPKARALRQRDRRKQVHVDVPEALAVKPVALDEIERLFVIRGDRRRKLPKKIEERRSIAQSPAGDFAKHEGMH